VKELFKVVKEVEKRHTQAKLLENHATHSSEQTRSELKKLEKKGKRDHKDHKERLASLKKECDQIEHVIDAKKDN